MYIPLCIRFTDIYYTFFGVLTFNKHTNSNNNHNNNNNNDAYDDLYQTLNNECYIYMMLLLSVYFAQSVSIKIILLLPFYFCLFSNENFIIEL